MTMTQGKLLYSPHCPSCKEKLDGFTAVSDADAIPKDGSLTVCAYCYSMLVFNNEQLVKLTEDDMNTLHPEEAAQLKMARAMAIAARLGK